jgi:hypothetical protein
VDSDVQVPSGLLKHLLELANAFDVKFLAACIQNHHGAHMGATNVMARNANLDGMMVHVPGLRPSRRGEWAVEPCDLTGAVVLLHRDIFESGVRYDDPADEPGENEDGPFCDRCAAAGFQPHYAPGVWATHWMTPPVDLGYLRSGTWHSRLARWHMEAVRRLAGVEYEERVHA